MTPGEDELPEVEVVLEFDAEDLRAAFGEKMIYFSDPGLGSDWEDEKEVRVLDDIPARHIRRVLVDKPELLVKWAEYHELPSFDMVSRITKM